MNTSSRSISYFGRFVAMLGLVAALSVAACGGGGGSAIAPGVPRVRPSGYASTGPSPTPQSSPSQHASPTPAPISMKHLLTWDNLGGDGGILNPWTLATPWLNYAQTPFEYSAAVYAAGIIPVPYTDPNRQSTTGPLYNNDESTFAHDCNGNRITQVGGVANGNYIMDAHSAHLAQLWHDYVASKQALGAIFSYIFEDNADEMGKVSAMPCNFNQNDWTNATNTMDQALGYPIIYNSLSHTSVQNNQPVVSPSIALNATTSGGMSEDCYLQANNQDRYNYNWQGSELTEIDMAAAGKLFVCDADTTTDASSSAGQRIYMLASFLLTYDPNTTIIEEHFKTASALHVFPEEQLVALDPLKPQPVAVSDLIQSGGSYGREYAQCYFAGVFVGSCAAAVNPMPPPSPAMPFPWPTKYHHTLTVRGYGVLDGGSAGVTGPAPPSSLAAGTAVIAFP